MGEVGPGQALREAEVVLDRRALPRLAARRLLLHDDGAQPLRGGVDGGGEAGRTAADDAQVVERLLGLGAQAERARQVEVRRRAQRLAVGHEHEREVVEPGLRELGEPAGLVVPVELEPLVRHVVAGEEGLDLVAALGPPVPDHPHLAGVRRVCRAPVAEQVVDHRVEPLRRRVPGLQQVVVEARRR